MLCSGTLPTRNAKSRPVIPGGALGTPRVTGCGARQPGHWLVTLVVTQATLSLGFLSIG